MRESLVLVDVLPIHVKDVAAMSCFTANCSGGIPNPQGISPSMIFFLQQVIRGKAEGTNARIVHESMNDLYVFLQSR